jgi:exopolyphosphatase/pppGpp-phosphohydrolase
MTLEQWGYIYQLIANGSLHERKKLPGMPPYRVTMMPYAMELIQVLIQEWRPERFYLSPAALKEGVLSEMLEAW